MPSYTSIFKLASVIIFLHWSTSLKFSSSEDLLGAYCQLLVSSKMLLLLFFLFLFERFFSWSVLGYYFLSMHWRHHSPIMASVVVDTLALTLYLFFVRYCLLWIESWGHLLICISPIKELASLCLGGDFLFILLGNFGASGISVCVSCWSTGKRSAILSSNNCFCLILPFLTWKSRLVTLYF